MPALVVPTARRLLLRASRAETTETLRRIHELGYEDVSLADTDLLANLDTEGATISALARRAGVTRQAASQQIAGLERAGYVERQSSYTDGRASVIFQTARGRVLLGKALDVVSELEQGYAKHLGKTRFSELTTLLAALLEHIDPVGGLGRD